MARLERARLGAGSHPLLQVGPVAVEPRLVTVRADLDHRWEVHRGENPTAPARVKEVYVRLNRAEWELAAMGGRALVGEVLGGLAQGLTGEPAHWAIGLGATLGWWWGHRRWKQAAGD